MAGMCAFALYARTVARILVMLLHDSGCRILPDWQS